MAHFAVRQPDGALVAACSVCKTAAATRFLPSAMKRRNYCDDHGPADPTLWRRLAAHTTPPKAHPGSTVLAPDDLEEDAPADDFEARVRAVLEKMGAPNPANAAAIERILEATLSTSLDDAAARIERCIADAIELRDALKAATTARETAERKFADGARLYREVERDLDAARKLASDRAAVIDNKDTRIDGLENDITHSRALAARAGRERDEARAEVAKMREQLRLADNTITSQRREIVSLTELLDEATRAEPAKQPVDEIDRALNGPIVDGPVAYVSSATSPATIAILESPPCQTFTPTTQRPKLLSEIVASIVRGNGAQPIAVPMKADKMFRDLQSGDRSRVRHALELYLTGRALRVEHLAHAGSHSPRRTRGRDLYALKAGRLRVVMEKTDEGYRIDSIDPAHDIS